MTDNEMECPITAIMKLHAETFRWTYPLRVDSSLNTVGAGVYNVVITSDLQNVTWTNVSSTIQVTGNSIQKTSGTSSWYDAGAVSSQTIVAVMATWSSHPAKLKLRACAAWATQI